MTNLEMTNEFPMTSDQWSLGIGHSLVIEAWSLVIYPQAGAAATH
jgi:hypothetical protein